MFSIESLDPQLLFRVLVVAEGLEPAFLERVNPSAGAVEVKLKRRDVPDNAQRVLGGRVLKDGEPVTGVVVGLVQADRSIMDSQISLRLGPDGKFIESNLAGPRPVRGFVGTYQIATDDHGEFLFRNVVAGEEMYVYGM